MAASLDVISDGRLEFMIGAGWYEAEYKGYCYPFLPFKIRAAQLKEAIEVLKLMWTGHRVYFNGKYYKLEERFVTLSLYRSLIFVCGWAAEVRSTHCELLPRLAMERTFSVLQKSLKGS